tara:strand:- start:523 stop:741 length:219 start_codon:yes stop_codon:yes gene_type:complete
MKYKVGDKFKDDEGDEFTIIAIGKEDFAVEYGESLLYTILGFNLETMNKYALHSKKSGEKSGEANNFLDMEF